jgi:GNAT superfamily N-acetyltransferase
VSAATVRAATPGDVADILRLIHGLAAYERAPDAVEATEPMLHAALFGEGAHVNAFVAEAGGRVIGIAVWFLNFSTWTGRSGLYLEDLFVEPEARGSGAGRLLLQALAREAVARGLPRVDWAVLDWNAPARGFYERIGAGERAEWIGCRLEGEALRALAE